MRKSAQAKYIRFLKKHTNNERKHTSCSFPYGIYSYKWTKARWFDVPCNAFHMQKPKAEWIKCEKCRHVVHGNQKNSNAAFYYIEWKCSHKVTEWSEVTVCMFVCVCVRVWCIRRFQNIMISYHLKEILQFLYSLPTVWHDASFFLCISSPCMYVNKRVRFGASLIFLSLFLTLLKKVDELNMGIVMNIKSGGVMVKSRFIRVSSTKL